MKKYIFFQIGILLSLLILCHSSFSQFMPQFGSLQLNYPLNNSVFQQDNNGQAKISFAGQVLKGTYYTNTQLNNLVIKIEQYDYNTGVWNYNNAYSISLESCATCDSDPNLDPKTFYLNSSLVTVFNKGWYRVSIGENISYCNSSRFIPITAWTKFGVGDVFVVAGQSNASGFTRTSGENLVPFESINENTPFSGPNDLPLNLLQDSEIKEGSIISRILKPRDLDFPTPPKGLPLFISQRSETDVDGLRKFISGKSGVSNVMGLAPNGSDSWSWCRFSNELVTEKKYPVLIFNAAVPNTSIIEWKNTNFETYLKTTLQMYGGAFGVKGVLWGQGEKETLLMVNAPPISSTNPPYLTYYARELNTIILNSRTIMGGSNNLNWFVGKTSYSTGGNPARPDSRVSPSPLSTSLQYSYKFLASTDSNNLIAKQDSVVNGVNVFSGFNSDEFREDYRSSALKLHFDGFLPSSAQNGLKKAGLKWLEAVSTGIPAQPTRGSNNNISAKQPNKIKVTKNNNRYELTILDPTNSFSQLTTGIFYWVKNEGGIDSKVVDTDEVPANEPYKYKIKASVSSSYFITCYYQANANSPLVPSQPYYVQSTCSGCRVGGGTQAVTRPTISIPANGGSGYSLLDNIKDGAFPKINTCLNWVDVTFDENTNTLVATASANNTAGQLSGDIIVLDEITGLPIQTIPITQAAGTPSGCTQKYLTTLTPINAEYQNGINVWAGYGNAHFNNRSIDNNLLLVEGYQTTDIGGTGTGIGTHALSHIIYNIGGLYKTFTGSVGIDDEVDQSCGGSQKMRFVVKGNGGQLWTSETIGTDVRMPFTIDVTNITTLELIVEPLDNFYCDHADWLDPVLSCSASTCTNPTNPTGTYADALTINSGSSTILHTTCPAGSTANWNNGLYTGSPVTVFPTSNPSVYSVKCKVGTCESIGQQSVSITVGTPPPSSGLVAGNCYAISPLTNLSNNMQAMGDGSIKQQGANGATNQIWRAEASTGNQLKFVSVATNQYITVSTPNYGDHMYLTAFSNNYQSWDITASGGNYRLSIPAYNITWDMEGAGTGQFLQNYGNTSEGFLNYRLWRFQSAACSNTSTGLTNNNCYIMRSVENNHPMQAMSDGKIQQQNNPNGQNNQIWKAEASGNQFMFKAVSNSQYISVNNSNNGTKMELGAAMAFDIQANGNNYRISKNGTTWDLEGAGTGLYLQNYGNTSESFQNYRLWSFENTTCPSNPTNNCINRNVTLGEAFYTSSSFGINNNANQDGGQIKIGGNGANSSPTTYTLGIGTHAFSEIIYNLGSHTFSKFKADVGRDYGSYWCDCGGQSIVFKIVDNNTGQVIGGPFTKTIWQTATAIEAPITGVTSLKLVVEDGGDAFYGDWADWANARLECPNNNVRQAAEQTIPDETIEGLTIFPNPTNDKLTTKFSLAEASKVSFDIVDLQGRNLETYNYKGEAGLHTFIIDVSKLNEGSYILRGMLGNKLEIRKFVIER